MNLVDRKSRIPMPVTSKGRSLGRTASGLSYHHRNRDSSRAFSLPSSRPPRAPTPMVMTRQEGKRLQIQLSLLEDDDDMSQSDSHTDQEVGDSTIDSFVSALDEPDFSHQPSLLFRQPFKTVLIEEMVTDHGPNVVETMVTCTSHDVTFSTTNATPAITTTYSTSLYTWTLLDQTLSNPFLVRKNLHHAIVAIARPSARNGSTLSLSRSFSNLTPLSRVSSTVSIESSRLSSLDSTSHSSSRRSSLGRLKSLFSSKESQESHPTQPPSLSKGDAEYSLVFLFDSAANQQLWKQRLTSLFEGTPYTHMRPHTPPPEPETSHTKLDRNQLRKSIETGGWSKLSAGFQSRNSVYMDQTSQSSSRTSPQRSIYGSCDNLSPRKFALYGSPESTKADSSPSRTRSYSDLRDSFYQNKSLESRGESMTSFTPKYRVDVSMESRNNSGIFKTLAPSFEETTPPMTIPERRRTLRRSEPGQVSPSRINLAFSASNAHPLIEPAGKEPSLYGFATNITPPISLVPSVSNTRDNSPSRSVESEVQMLNKIRSEAAQLWLRRQRSSPTLTLAPPVSLQEVVKPAVRQLATNIYNGRLPEWHALAHASSRVPNTPIPDVGN